MAELAPIFRPEERPKRMSKERLLAVIDRIREEVERDASMEGALTYGWSEEPGEYDVRAFVRTGNDMGQGGAMIVQEDQQGGADVPS